MTSERIFLFEKARRRGDGLAPLATGRWGHTYLDEPDAQVSAGIEDCDAWETTGMPSRHHELLVLEEGGLTIVPSDGGEAWAMVSGEIAILPCGSPARLRFGQATRIHYFRYVPKDAVVQAPEFIRADIDVELRACPGPTPEMLVRGEVPDTREYVYFRQGAFGAGMWRATPYWRKRMPFPRFELMRLLSGSTSMPDAQGRGNAARAGETLLALRGADTEWRNDETVTKVSCTVS